MPDKTFVSNENKDIDNSIFENIQQQNENIENENKNEEKMQKQRETTKIEETEKNIIMSKEEKKEYFIKVIKAFKEDFINKTADKEYGKIEIDDLTKNFYNSDIFEKIIKLKAIEIADDDNFIHIYAPLTYQKKYYEIDKKIKKMTEKGILNKNLNIEKENIMNSDYIKSIINSAKEKNIDITKEEIYTWILFKPIVEHDKEFKRIVQKTIGIKNEDIDKIILKENMKENNFNDFDDNEIKKILASRALNNLTNSVDLWPNSGFYSYIVSNHKIQPDKPEDNPETVKKLDNIQVFDTEDLYKAYPDLKNNINLKIFANETLLNALYLATNKTIDKSELLKIRDYIEQKYKDSAKTILGDGFDLNIPAFMIKNEILKEIEENIENKKAKEILKDIIKIKENIIKNPEINKYKRIKTVNDYYVFVNEKDYKQIKDNSLNIFFDNKNKEAYYIDNDGIKHILNINGVLMLKEIEKIGREELKNEAKEEKKVYDGFTPKFIEGNIYNIDPETEEITNIKDKYLAEVMYKTVDELKINKNLTLEKNNFDNLIFDNNYHKISLADGYSELVSIVRKKYHYDSADQAIERIIKTGLGHLVLKNGESDLKAYQKEGLKALSLIKTMTFIDENKGEIKAEMEESLNPIINNIMTKDEREEFLKAKEKEEKNLKTVSKKIYTYKKLINEKVDLFYKRIKNYALKNFIPESEKENIKIYSKKDLLNLLEKYRKENTSSISEKFFEYHDTVKLLKQLIARDKIDEKNKESEQLISFFKTLIRNNEDLKLTFDYKEKLDKIMNVSIKNHFFKNVFERNKIENLINSNKNEIIMFSYFKNRKEEKTENEEIIKEQISKESFLKNFNIVNNKEKLNKIMVSLSETEKNGMFSSALETFIDEIERNSLINTKYKDAINRLYKEFNISNINENIETADFNDKKEFLKDIFNYEKYFSNNSILFERIINPLIEKEKTIIADMINTDIDTFINEYNTAENKEQVIKQYIKNIDDINKLKENLNNIQKLEILETKAPNEIFETISQIADTLNISEKEKNDLRKETEFILIKIPELKENENVNTETIQKTLIQYGFLSEKEQNYFLNRIKKERILNLLMENRTNFIKEEDIPYVDELIKTVKEKDRNIQSKWNLFTFKKSRLYNELKQINNSVQKIKYNIKNEKANLTLNIEQENYYISKEDYNEYRAEADNKILNFKDANNVFYTILKSSDSFEEFQDIITKIKENKIDNYFLLSEILSNISEDNKGEELTNPFKASLQTKKDFLNFNAFNLGIYNYINKYSVSDLSEEEINNLFSKFINSDKKEKFFELWEKFIYTDRINYKVKKSMDIIINNLSLDTIKRSYDIKEKYNLTKEDQDTILKKYNLLKKIETEFQTRKELYNHLFENSKVKISKIEDLNEITKNEIRTLKNKKRLSDKKQKLLNGFINFRLILMQIENDKNITLNDLKKLLKPREDIDIMFGLFKEHLIENKEKLADYEDIITKKINENQEQIERRLYNKYIGMNEQLKNMKFHGKIEEIIHSDYINSIDSDLIENYQKRVNEFKNISANLTNIISKNIYDSSKKIYEARIIQKEIEKTALETGKGLVPILVQEDEKNVFPLNIHEKELEKLYKQNKQIWNILKEKYYNPEKKEFNDSFYKLFNDKEKEYIKQLTLLDNIEYPYIEENEEERKKIINAILKLTTTFDGKTVFSKEDLTINDKNGIVIKKDFRKEFKNIAEILPDKNLLKINIETADLNAQIKNKIEKRIDTEQSDIDTDINKEKKNYEMFIEELETNLLTISTEIDNLEGKIKNIKNEMMSIRDRIDRKFNEKLKNNRAFNGTSMENAFNLVRFPLLMFETFQVGVETFKSMFFEYLEYKKRIIPLKEEISKRKKDIITLMKRTEKTEKIIADEMNNFHQNFFAQKYNSMREMIDAIEKMAQKGNKFAQHVLNNNEICEKDENGQIIFLNTDKLNEEFEKTKSLLFGVYRANKGGYRNIESLNRIKNRMFSIFAESQPNIFDIVLGGRDKYFYDDSVDVRIRNIFKPKFTLKEGKNLKEYLVKMNKIQKEKVETLKKYIDIDSLFYDIEKINNKKLLRSKDNKLMLFSVNERAIATLKNELKDNEKTVDEVIDNFINMSSLYIFDVKRDKELIAMVNKLKKNSQISNIIKQIIKEEKEGNLQRSINYLKLENIALKIFLNTDYKLSDKEKEILTKENIDISKIKTKMVNNEKLKKLVSANLDKMYAKSAERFYINDMDKEKKKMPLSILYKSAEEDMNKIKKREMTKEEFINKYSISPEEVLELKENIKQDFIKNIISKIDLEDYNKIKGSKISLNTVLITQHSDSVLKEVEENIDDIKYYFENSELSKEAEAARVRMDIRDKKINYPKQNKTEKIQTITR